MKTKLLNIRKKARNKTKNKKLKNNKGKKYRKNN